MSRRETTPRRSSQRTHHPARKHTTHASPPAGSSQCQAPAASALEAFAALAALPSTPDLDETLRTALARICDVLSAEGGAVALWEGDALILRAAQGWRNDLDTIRARLEKGNCDSWMIKVAASGKRRAADVRRNSRRLAASEFHDQDVYAVGLAPLNGQAQVRGVLSLFRRDPRPFRPDELDLLTAMANLLALAVENARLRCVDERCQRLDAIVQVAEKARPRTE